MSSSSDSLLAHLTYSLSNRTEIVATKSLAYILRNSTAARFALEELLRKGGADVDRIQRVESEVAGDNQERVDLAVYNHADQERVLIEAKFWAGLTENQPDAYIKRLPIDGKPSVLLFVAPQLRLQTLWSDVQRRAEKAGFTLELSGAKGDFSTATVVAGNWRQRRNRNRKLMMTSWRTLLQTMRSRAATEGDDLAKDDIRQLNALCERQDTDAFLPIRADEFNPELPRRLRDLRRLVDDAVARARAEDRADTKGLRTTPKAVGYGTYLRLGSKAKGVWAEAWLGVNYESWCEYGFPLWIEFNGNGMSKEEVEQKLRYVHGWFELPIGKEYDEVLNALVYDLCMHARRLCDEMGDDEWDRYAGTQPIP